MQVTQKMVNELRIALEGIAHLSDGEARKALAAALSKAEPVGVGVKELIAMMRGRVGDTFNEVAEFSAEEVETIISSLSLPCKENGETVTPAQDVAGLADLIKRIADTPIWQDTYPDGPEMMDGDYRITPADVRACRAAATEADRG